MQDGLYLADVVTTICDNRNVSTAKVNMTGYAACAGAGILWSFGFFFGKIALREMSPESMVLYRFLFAAVGMLPVAVWSWRAGVRMRGVELGILLLGALLGFPLQFLSQFHGLEITTVSHAALMVGTMPMLLALGAVLFAGEHLDRVGWVALVGSTGGAVLIVLSKTPSVGGPQPSLAGDLLVVLSMLIGTGWILLNKRLLRTHDSLAVSSYNLLAGTGMLAVWVLGRDACLVVTGHGAWPPVHGVSEAAWLALVASGLLCTSATTLLWNWGIHRVPASRAGVFLNFEPALGSVLGVELLGEHLGPLALVGGGLILIAAVTLTVRGHEMVPD